MAQLNNVQRNNNRGVTLTEVVMATLIMGVILVGALSVVSSSLRTRMAASRRNDGARLTEQLLAEVMAMPYKDPQGAGTGTGPETGESTTTRADFDDVDDYNGWNESDVQDKDGNTIEGFDGWSRSVETWRAERLGGNPWFSDTGLKRIRVRATSPEGVVTERLAFRGEWGSLQQQPSQDTTVVTMISGELEIGGSSTKAHAATNTFNHAPDPNAP